MKLEEEICTNLIVSTLKHGPAKKADFFAVLNDALPEILTEQQKLKKLSNLLQKMKREGIIEVNGFSVDAEWTLLKKD